MEFDPHADKNRIMPISQEMANQIAAAMRDMLFLIENWNRADEAMRQIHRLPRYDIIYGVGHVKHTSLLKFEARLTEDDITFLRTQGIAPE